MDLGSTVRIGYFTQEGRELDPTLRVYDFIRAIASEVQTDEGTFSASQMLERFLFDSSLQFTPIGRLSGGERRRLYLLSILMITFFCYCALEQTASLWSGSYFAIQRGANAEEAARLAGLFFLGITAGRAAAGFLTFFLNDVKTVRWGQLLSLAGILLLLVPDGVPLAGISLILVGLGCAPIFPSMMHATPSRFGAERSQAIVGIQMASAYAGTCLMPPVFGLLAQAAGISLFPGFLLLMLALMAVTHERTIRITAHRKHLSDAPS